MIQRLKGRINNLVELVPHSGKAAAYEGFRKLLNQDLVECYEYDLLKSEMVELRSEERNGKLAIFRPKSGTDDIIDSLVFAGSPFYDGKVFTGAGVGVLFV